VQPLPFCLLSAFPVFFAAFAAAFFFMTGLLFSSIIADNKLELRSWEESKLLAPISLQHFRHH
jgi:hypothetical protein